MAVPVAAAADVLAPADALPEAELAGAGAVTVLVIAAGLAPESPASLTREAASTPSASTTMAAREAAGAPQLGEPARRVRAAAPQRRHQSCSLCSAELHSGQVSAAARNAWLEALLRLAVDGGEAATLIG
jgi:hypothetical protein